MSSTFNQLIKTSSKRYIKVSIKRRTAQYTWETNWQEIDSSRISSIGEVKKILNDKYDKDTYLKNESVKITFINVDNYFSENNNANSFFYGYFLHNSALKVELGYEDTDGSIVWADYPIIEGLIKGNQTKFYPNYTVDYNVLGYLSFLDEITVEDIYARRIIKTTAADFMNLVINFMVTTLSFATFTNKGVGLPSDWIVTDLMNSDIVMEIVDALMKQSETGLVITKDRQICIRRINNEGITAPVEFATSGATAVWYCNTSSAGYIPDETGNNHRLYAEVVTF